MTVMFGLLILIHIYFFCYVKYKALPKERNKNESYKNDHKRMINMNWALTWENENNVDAEFKEGSNFEFKLESNFVIYPMPKSRPFTKMHFGMYNYPTLKDFHGMYGCFADKDD